MFHRCFFSNTKVKSSRNWLNYTMPLWKIDYLSKSCPVVLNFNGACGFMSTGEEHENIWEKFPHLLFLTWIADRLIGQICKTVRTDFKSVQVQIGGCLSQEIRWLKTHAENAKLLCIVKLYLSKHNEWNIWTVGYLQRCTVP